MIRFKLSSLVTIFLCLVLSLPAVADPGKFLPYVALKQEYSNNILFSASNEVEDSITTGTVGLIYDYDSERIDAKLDGRLYHLFYRDNDDLDSTDGSVFANWNYQVTERTGVGVSADYRNDSRPDEDLTTTGVLMLGDRKDGNLSTSSSYMFSETLRGEVALGFGLGELITFNNKENGENISLDLAFSKNLSEIFKNTTGLLNFNYFYYDADYETTISTPTVYRDFRSDVFQLSAGFSKDITELYNIYLQAGASYTKTSEGRRLKAAGIDLILPDEDSSTWGGVFSAGLNYDGLYYDVDVSISQDMRGSLGTNGVVQRSAISLGIDRKFSDNLWATFDASYFLNQNERQTRADLDDLTFNIQPGFRYEFLDTFTLSGIYRYTTVDDRTHDTSTVRSMVYLMIRKDFDL